MRIFVTIICIFISLCIACASNTEVDSLVAYYHRKMSKDKPYDVGQVRAICYINGLSICQDSGLVSRRFYKHLPFQSKKSSQTAFYAVYSLLYSYPGNVKIDCQSLESNDKSVSSRALQEFERVMIPIFPLRREEQPTSVKAYVMPFSKDGIYSYRYRLSKSVDCDVDTIFFVPKFKHSTLVSGYALHDNASRSITNVHFNAQVLLGSLQADMAFAVDSVTHWFLPTTYDAIVTYKIGKTKGQNRFHCRYVWKDIHSMSSVHSTKYRQLDMSNIYNISPSDTLDCPHDFRVAVVDSIINSDTHKSTLREKNNLGIKLLELLSDGHRLANKTDEAKIYGPLNPASFGLGGIDGLWVRLRGRWSHRFSNNKELMIKPQIGYSFKRKELKFRLSADYVYNTLHPSGITISAERGNSGFSSFFINKVNEALKSKKDTIDFSSLGVDFYNHYSYRISNHNEIANGLTLRVGVTQNYRSPVMRGVNAISEERREELVGTSYSDFSPFIELTWVPRSYFYIENGHKRYVGSAYPVFKLWSSRSIPNVLGTNSNYGEVELDIQQVLLINHTRTLSMRLGMGTFFGKDGEYFINYEYFSRGKYPDIWQDEHVGGTFRLLDDYWYASTEMYAQMHVMYETPFGFVNRIPLLSRYVVKDRYYIGTLFTDHKPVYTELGYGFGNNYFSTGFFVGFKGFQYNSFGYRIQIAIDKHLR